MHIDQSDESDGYKVLPSKFNRDDGIIRAISSLEVIVKRDQRARDAQRLEDLARNAQEREEVKASISELHERIDGIPGAIKEDVYRDINRIDNRCVNNHNNASLGTKDCDKPSFVSVLFSNPHAVWMLCLAFLLISGSIYYSVTGQVPMIPNQEQQKEEQK